eukprot:750744-Hanusia_phi.AAC.2
MGKVCQQSRRGEDGGTSIGGGAGRGNKQGGREKRTKPVRAVTCTFQGNSPTKVPTGEERLAQEILRSL